MQNRTALAAVSLVLVWGSCCVNGGVTWEQGDVIASSAYLSSLEAFNSTLGRKGSVAGGVREACSTTQLLGGAFNNARTIFWVACADNTIIAVNATGTEHEVLSTWQSGEYGVDSWAPSDIAVDRNGDLYVSHFDGQGRVYKHAPDGTLLATFDVQTSRRGSAGVALSADDTVLFTTSYGPEVFRFDIVANAPMQPLVQDLPATRCYGLRVLRDGSFIVGCEGAVFLLSATGAVTQTFAPDSTAWYVSVAVDPQEQFFYTVDYNPAQLWKVQLSDVTIKYYIKLGNGRYITALSVLGESVRGCSSGACCDVTTNTTLPAGTVCRRAVDACDATERCTGTSASCPNDISAPDGTTCPFFGHQDESRKHGYPYGVDASPLQRKAVGKEEAATLEASLFNEGRTCWGKCVSGQCYMSRRARSCCYTPSLAEAQGVGAEAGAEEEARLFCWD